MKYEVLDNTEFGALLVRKMVDAIADRFGQSRNDELTDEAAVTAVCVASSVLLSVCGHEVETAVELLRRIATLPQRVVADSE